MPTRTDIADLMLRLERCSWDLTRTSDLVLQLTKAVEELNESCATLLRGGRAGDRLEA